MTGTHWRLFCAIAYHDRFKANGIGCYASPSTLCKETGIHPTNFARTARELVALGYLTENPHPFAKRLSVYSVDYGEKPDLVGQLTNIADRESAPATNIEAKSDAHLVKPPTMAPNDLVVPPAHVPETIDEGGGKYIPLSGSLRNSAAASEIVRFAANRVQPDQVQKLNGGQIAERMMRLCAISAEELWLALMQAIPSEGEELLDPDTDDGRLLNLLIELRARLDATRATQRLNGQSSAQG